MRGNATRRGGRGRKGKASAEEEIPEVYMEMLQDVLNSESSGSVVGNSEGSARKRRKISGEETVAAESQVLGKMKEDVRGKGKSVAVEVSSDSEEEAAAEKEDETTNDIESEDDSDESDIDWEDVDLSIQPIVNPAEPLKSGPLELVLNSKGKRKIGPARRKITAVERRIRLEVHKMHLLCLLFHVYLRNKWCNSSVIKENLRPLISEEVYTQLNWNPQDQQFRRSHRFLEGLKNAVNTWKKNFKITREGISRPYWKPLETLKNFTPPINIDPPMTKDDFLAASRHLKGSRDLGAQFFCALLRSAGITCRLVCSLQPLLFSFAGDEKAPRVKPQPTIPAAYLEDSDNANDDGTSIQPNHRPGGPGPSTTPARARRGGLRRPRFREPLIKPTPVKKPEINILESPYPIYWVEAWNVAMQKWITVDPMATEEVGKPSKIEPPLSDRDNLMSYVVGFEEEGQVKDVTRRYAKSYHGRTRRFRINSTKGGEEWWRKVLSNFQRGYELDRDQVEEAELSQKEVSEGIPDNVQDLKDHPLFALKRHLRRHEVIHPERKIGVITTGTGKSKVTETIFRREDVKTVKSSVQWYRLGREIKTGEQPIKYVTPRRNRKRDHGVESEDEEGERGEEKNGQVGMYAEFQTVLYEPPDVVEGCVPKNGYGNLDIFVPSMVPKGGVHLPYKEAAKAAKLLGIDYAEAVTGFEFKNRQASATINGVVVAKEYREAVEVVVQGFSDEKEEAEAAKKSMEDLKRRRRILLESRIRKRLGIYDEPDEDKEEERGGETKILEEGDEDMGEEFIAEDLDGRSEEGSGFVDEDMAGGFHLEDADEQIEQGGRFVDENMAGGFLPENVDEQQSAERTERGARDGMAEEICGRRGFIEKDMAGGFLPEDKEHQSRDELTHNAKTPKDTTEEIVKGGGFIVGEGEGGGFLPELSEGKIDEEEDDGMLSEDPDDKDFEWY